MSVDPLTKNYPELTPYQFASNSPISGIDLDGKEYLSAFESRIRIDGTVVSLNLTNFHEVSQNIWNFASQDPKNWPTGHIGLPTEIGEISVLGVPEFPDELSLDNTYGATDPNYNPTIHNVENPIAESTGLPDRRYNQQTLSGGNSSSSGVAVGVLAFNLVNWGLDEFLNYQTADDRDLVYEHTSLLRNQVATDLNKAIKKGLVPSKYLNAKNLGDISNVILTGVNNTKDKGIYDVGIKIVKLISKNYKAPPKPKKIFKLGSADHTKYKQPVILQK